MCRNDGPEIDMNEYEIVKRGISIIVYALLCIMLCIVTLHHISMFCVHFSRVH